ncbi:mutarotase [Panacibacter sp. DH6]|uniref:Mutarotase n=1 Tax=Panacibacter microcysteis TaxID=2793269 RepID=A0A931E428_9BACT|nr:hypothetical protein [Panacibacter microcysteis]MBG9375171.1 mutarotase [Panacibacter microcysteis]
MQLKEHYTNLWNNALSKFEANAFEFDTLIDSVKDHRFGVTLVAKPSGNVKKNIHQMLLDLRAIEPGQYYYPTPDIHVTVLSIISCYNGFKLASIHARDYIAIIKKSLHGITSFPVFFEGITASPSCIMVQGFAGNEIENLRNNLRSNFKNTDLESSIDKRYQIHTAHATVIRFRHALQQPQKFVERLKYYRNFHFGVTEVQEVSFVFNDWYQRHLDEHVLATFSLPLYL